MNDAFAIGEGTIFFPADDKGRMQVVFFLSSFFSESEQQTAVIQRELTAIFCEVKKPNIFRYSALNTS